MHCVHNHLSSSNQHLRMTTIFFLLLMMIHKIKNVNHLRKFKFEKNFLLSSHLPQTPTTDSVVFTAFLSHYLYTYRCTCESSSDTVIVTSLQTSDIKDCTYFCNTIYSTKLHVRQNKRWQRCKFIEFARTRSCHMHRIAIFNIFLSYLTAINQLLLVTTNFIFRLVSFPFLLHIS
jgi:hypothetical protein